MVVVGRVKSAKPHKASLRKRDRQVGPRFKSPTTSIERFRCLDLPDCLKSLLERQNSSSLIMFPEASFS